LITVSRGNINISGSNLPPHCNPLVSYQEHIMTSSVPESNALSILDTEEFGNSPLIPLSSTQSTSPQQSFRKRQRTSFIWEHMPDPPHTIYAKGQFIYWHCRYCPKQYRESGGTTFIIRHLESHDIVDTKRVQQASSQQLSITSAFERGEESQHKRRRLDSTISDINPAALEQLLVRWISRCSIPFRMVECPEFRDLLFFLNPGINTWLPTEHHTIQSWTLRAFELEKQRVQQALQSAQSKIHFTVDLWTSTNSKALLGIIGHYFADNGDLRQSVLALRELEGQHTGKNQSQLIMKIIEEYGIASKVGYFMMDNAENNETMIKALSSCKLLLLRQYIANY